MAGIAMIFGTLFWFTLFVGFMVTFFVLVKGGFGGKSLVEAALAMIIMIGLGVPLSIITRKLSGKVVTAAQGSEEPDSEEATGRRTTRRVNRRSGLAGRTIWERSSHSQYRPNHVDPFDPIRFT